MGFVFSDDCYSRDIVVRPGYELVGLAYEKLGIWSSWVTQAGLLFIVAAIIFSVLRFALKWKPTVSFSLSDHGAILGGRLSFDSACLLGYVAFACVFAGGLFVWYLGSPYSYAQQFDNISHLGTIQSFVNSGVWSPFASSLYSSASDAAINPLPGGGFYPTAWYSVAALAVTSMGVTTAFAENVANFVFVAFVLPAGSFAFMRVLFDDRRAVIPFGAFCTLLFAGFPWMIILFGPLYPNLSAFCLVSAAAATFLLMFQFGCSRKQRVGLAVVFVFALMSLALAQPIAYSAVDEVQGEILRCYAYLVRRNCSCRHICNLDGMLQRSFFGFGCSAYVASLC